MSRLNITVIAAAMFPAFSAGAIAQTMSKEQYKSGKDGIAADYKSAKAACGSLSGNAKDICKAEASGKENVAKAELDARNKPSADARYKVASPGQTPNTRWPRKSATTTPAMSRTSA